MSKSEREKMDTVKKRSPQWSLATKPEMVVGGGVPSWTKSIPAPGTYSYPTDAYKNRAPTYTMRVKPEIVVGGVVPSWGKTIPGPKYAYDSNVIKQRQPVYSMPGRPKAEKSLTASAPALSQDALKSSFEAANKKPPSFSLKSRPKVIPGEVPPSNNVPGPGVPCETDKFKRRQPSWHIGAKLPTEIDNMKSRSPGPARYTGTAMESKKQECVDSTRRRTPAPGFGYGERWKGTEYELVRSGAMARYNAPC